MSDEIGEEQLLKQALLSADHFKTAVQLSAESESSFSEVYRA